MSDLADGASPAQADGVDDDRTEATGGRADDRLAEEAAAELDGARGASSEGQIAADSFWARTVFSGSPVTISGDLIVQGEGRGAERLVVTTIDITDAAKQLGTFFVAPPFFAALEEKLASTRMVLVVGTGCGKQTAGAAALHGAKCRPVLQLPGDLSSAELLSAIEWVLEKYPGAGLLLDGLSGDAVGGLAGFQLQRLTNLLDTKSGRLVLSGTEVTTGRSRDSSMPVVSAEPPDPVAVARSVAKHRELPADKVARVEAALDLLPRPIAPWVAVEVVSAVVEGASDPDAIAARFRDGITDDELVPWIREHRSPHAIASVAAAIALERCPLSDVDELAADLERRLQGPPAEGQPPPADSTEVDLAARTWPDAILTVGRHSFPTHFGRQEVEVPEIRTPHDRQRVISVLWQAVGPKFRVEFLDWLFTAAEHRSAVVRSGVAATAGALLFQDPLLVERDLLRRWVLDDRASSRACAALAVGVPVAMGSDPAMPRGLVKAWATSRDLRMRKAAVLAYGGLLGAGDPGAAAASHLWRIGEQHQELRPLADAALAALTAFGTEGEHARSTVMGVLVDRVEDRRSRPRVLGIVPLIARELTRRGAHASASLAAVETEADGRTYAAYAALIARAFDSPGSAAGAAPMTFRVFLDAAARGELDSDWFKRLVKEMRSAARARGREAALAAQLQQALRAEHRRRSPRAEHAKGMLETFFRSPTKEQAA